VAKPGDQTGVTPGSRPTKHLQGPRVAARTGKGMVENHRIHEGIQPSVLMYHNQENDMSASKQDYEAIAQILRTAAVANRPDAVHDIRINIATYFAGKNAAFDIGRFVKAASAPIVG
jgi:hypothetical protein